MKEYSIKSGFFDRPRKLLLTEDYVEWEDGDLKGKEFSRLNKSDYLDFKHGTEWIVWYKFTVGRNFTITLKDSKKKEYRIRFQSYFNSHEQAHKKYSDIVDNIWHLYHTDAANGFLNSFYQNGEAELQGFKLKEEGIELRDKKGLIPWAKVATKEYYTYFAIYDQDNSAIHSRVSYNEYGTETLWSAIREILKKKVAALQKKD